MRGPQGGAWVSECWKTPALECSSVCIYIIKRNKQNKIPLLLNPHATPIPFNFIFSDHSLYPSLCLVITCILMVFNCLPVKLHHATNLYLERGKDLIWKMWEDKGRVWGPSGKQACVCLPQRQASSLCAGTFSGWRH